MQLEPGHNAEVELPRGEGRTGPAQPDQALIFGDAVSREWEVREHDLVVIDGIVLRRLDAGEKEQRSLDEGGLRLGGCRRDRERESERREPAGDGHLEPSGCRSPSRRGSAASAALCALTSEMRCSRSSARSIISTWDGALFLAGPSAAVLLYSAKKLRFS